MKFDERTVWVFDLDDTLYPEFEYQNSGYEFIVQYIWRMYGIDVSDVVSVESSKKDGDVFSAICHSISIPDEMKQSLLWMYRLHFPSITLAPDVKDFLSFVKKKCLAVAIITDGRSITQRNKCLALGLYDFDLLVSEEWGELKPGRRRFQSLENKYPLASRFIYVADNVVKDFITPNEMGWVTIGLRDHGQNIHSQAVSVASNAHHPGVWIDSFSELKDKIC